MSLLEIQITIDGIEGYDPREIERKALAILDELLDTDKFAVGSWSAAPSNPDYPPYQRWSVTATPAAMSSDIADRLGNL